MAKIHLIEDKTIGGIKREYIEVERRADVGEKIIIVKERDDNGDGYSCGDTFVIKELDGKHELSYTECGITLYDEEYLVLDPTNIVHIEDKKYQLVKRIAEDGEKVLVVNWESDHICNDVQIGEVLTTDTMSFLSGKVVHVVERDTEAIIRPTEYRVLIPVDSEPAEPTPDIHDLLANLAQRVTSLERITGELVRAKSSLESQLRDTQNNVQTFAELAETTKELTESNTKDIAFLDERTYEKPGKPAKSAEEILREISKILERDECQ